MSKEMIANMLELFDSMDKHTPFVEQRMRDLGYEVNPMVARSIAKYWDALEMLAAE